MTDKVLYTRYQNIVTAIGNRKGSRAFSFTLKQAIRDWKKVVRKEDKYPTSEQHDNALAFIEGVISKFGEKWLDRYTVNYNPKDDIVSVTSLIAAIPVTVQYFGIKEAHNNREYVLENEKSHRSHFAFAEALALADYIIAQFPSEHNNA